MTKKSEVLRLAVKAHEQEQVVRGMGMVNTASRWSAEEQVNFEAKYRLAQDLMYKYRTEYHQAFETWYKEGAKDD